MIDYDTMRQINIQAMQGYLLMVIFCALGAAIVFIVVRKTPHKCPALPSIPLMYSLIAGALMRIPNLFNAFWYDETFTAAVSRSSLPDALTIILADVHPIGAYIPYWIIGQVTTIEPILRLPSYAAGIALIYACYKIGNLTSERAGEYAAALCAITPALIWYSTEARAYMFLTLAVFVAIYGLLADERKPLIYALLSLPLLHAYGYIYAGIIGLYALYSQPTRQRLQDLILAALPALLWLPFMFAQSQDVADGFWLTAPRIGAAFYPLLEMSIGTGYPPNVAMVVIPIILVIFFLGMAHERRAAYWWIAITVPAIAFTISHLWQPIYLPRAILPAVSILFVLMVSRYLLRAPRVLTLLLVTALLTVNAYQFLHPKAQRLDTAAFVASCGDRPIYSYTLEAGIIASHYSEYPVTVHPNGSNLNQTLIWKAILAMGIDIAPAPRAGACIYWQDTPMTYQHQRERLKVALQLLDYEQGQIQHSESMLHVETYIPAIEVMNP